MPVHCPKCKRFLFNIVVTMQRPPIGTLGEIRDFRCPKCKHYNLVLMGISEKDERSTKERVEDQLKKQMQELS